MYYADQNSTDRKFPGNFAFQNHADQVDIEEYVNVEIKGNAIMIFPATANPREGWAEQFRLAAEDATVSDDENLMDDGPNAFDDSEWTW